MACGNNFYAELKLKCCSGMCWVWLARPYQHTEYHRIVQAPSLPPRPWRVKTSVSHSVAHLWFRQGPQRKSPAFTHPYSKTSNGACGKQWVQHHIGTLNLTMKHRHHT